MLWLMPAQQMIFNIFILYLEVRDLAMMFKMSIRGKCFILTYFLVISVEGPCRNTLATLRHDYKLNFQYEGKVWSKIFALVLWLIPAQQTIFIIFILYLEVSGRELIFEMSIRSKCLIPTYFLIISVLQKHSSNFTTQLQTEFQVWRKSLIDFFFFCSGWICWFKSNIQIVLQWW